MESKHFSFSDVLGYGWSVMKANLWFFIGMGVVYVLIQQLPNIANALVKNMSFTRPVGTTLSMLLSIAGWIISIVLAIGIIKIALSFCDQQKPAFGTLFNAQGCFWRYVGVMILYTLIILAGFILLIIPGIIWAIKYSLCYYFVVDKGLDPVNALKASARTTMGAKWELLGFGIVCALINILGMLCLIIGIFATYPMILIASALVYRQLLVQTPELAEFGIAIPDAEPDTTTPPADD